MQTDKQQSTDKGLHTPGEWKIQQYGAMPNQRILSEQDKIIADCYSFSEGISEKEAHANARLISSAPALKEENEKLKERVKYLEGLINEYILKMKVNLSGGKVDEFLKAQLSDPDDLKGINI